MNTDTPQTTVRTKIISALWAVGFGLMTSSLAIGIVCANLSWTSDSKVDCPDMIAVLILVMGAAAMVALRNAFVKREVGNA